MLKSPLLAIFLIVSVDVLGLTIILPLLPFYAEKLGASPAVVGMLVSTYALCQLIAGPILGRMSDHTGRRPLLLVSQLGTFIGFLILAYANALWLVFVSRVIDGLTAGNLSLAQAYISDVTKPEDRAKSFALIGIAFGMGFLIGPAISGFLAQYSYQYPIFAAAALSATSILSTYFLLPSNVPVAADTPRKFTVLDWGNYLRYFREPGLGPLLWQFLAFALTFSLFMTGFPLFAERRFLWQGHPFGAKEVGYVYAYLGFLGVILQGGLMGRLVRVFGEINLVRAGFFVAMVGLAALAFTSSIPLLLVVAAAASLGTGMNRPALTSLITQRASRSEQGVVLGITQSLNSLAAICAPTVAGFLIDHSLLTVWALLAAVISGAALLFKSGQPELHSSAAQT
ncbi:MAG TPA: MFS transporter [Bryobacteraceae bacterium]|nr:MFS transporter [Bryobacteraceae bacterium]